MSTLNEIIYNIKNIRKAGGLTDDDDLSNRQLYFIVGYVRSMLIKEYIQKSRSITSAMVQSLPCVELVIADQAECCDIKTNCKILRTKERLPQILEFNGKLLFKFIGTLSGEEFTYTSESQIVWLQYRKYNKGRYAYFRNGYLYIVSELDLQYIRVDAVFEDPTELASYTDCNSNKCFDPESPYPLPEYMIQPLTSLIFSRELRDWMNGGRQDNRNNAEDDPQ